MSVFLLEKWLGQLITYQVVIFCQQLIDWSIVSALKLKKTQHNHQNESIIKQSFVTNDSTLIHSPFKLFSFIPFCCHLLIHCLIIIDQVIKCKTFVFLYFMCKRSSSSDHDASFLLTEDGRRAGRASEPQTSTSSSCPLRKTERKERESARERGKRERTSVRRSEGSGWKQSMDAVRIEGTARFSLTRKRKISKLSRRIETRRQVRDLSSELFDFCTLYQCQCYQCERETHYGALLDVCGVFVRVRVFVYSSPALLIPRWRTVSGSWIWSAERLGRGVWSVVFHINSFLVKQSQQSHPTLLQGHITQPLTHLPHQPRPRSCLFSSPPPPPLTSSRPSSSHLNVHCLLQ